MKSAEISGEPKKKASYLNRKLILPLLDFLKQGISPGKLATTVAFGTVWGTFPILGTNTVICIITAIVFRLNHAAIQLVNYIVYPLQILLFIPFIKLGLWISGEQELKYSFEELWEIIKTDQLEAFRTIGGVIWSGVIGWFLFAIPCFLVLTFVLRPLFDRIVRKQTD
ncbi:MAG: DUF2062 domain-containing protein [Cyclobacteriaceae bacterium]